jgi:cell division protein FtsZ
MVETLVASRLRKSEVEAIGRMKVIGIGDAGCNIINQTMCKGLTGVDFININTDARALALSEAPTRILLGEKLATGSGVGGDPKLAFKAAEENRHTIESAVLGADVVLIVAGMGGATGTGVTPVVAEIAKESGSLTIALITEPFSFEGEHRVEVAKEGIQRLSTRVDTLVIIRNDLLLRAYDTTKSVDDIFRMVNEILLRGVRVIYEATVSIPGLIKLDFADIRSVLKDAGPARISFGKGSGDNRAVNAAKSALSTPLMDIPVNEAKCLLFNITGGPSLTLFECNEAAQVIGHVVAPDATIVFGVAFDPAMNNEVDVTIVAAGLSRQHAYELLGLGGLLTEIMEFQEAKAFFEANRRKLLDKYEGKCVAILNREVIDADDDFSLLAERVYSRYGYKDIYMPKVEKKRTILHIPTPRVKKG